jgi:high mobility group protein B1
MVKAKAAKKKKMGKDPNAPKRGKSSYFHFADTKRAEIKSANPDWKIGDISKEIGRIWKEELSDKEKEPFIKLAADEKAAYDKAMTKYKKSKDYEKYQKAKKKFQKEQ